MLCGELHIFHDLVLDKNVNANAYLTLFLHEALDVEHKMLILEIGLYHNTFSYLCVQHKSYPEHDTLCLSILVYSLFSYIFLINNSMFTMLHRQMFLESFCHTDITVFCEIMH